MHFKSPAFLFLFLFFLFLFYFVYLFIYLFFFFFLIMLVWSNGSIFHTLLLGHILYTKLGVTTYFVQGQNSEVDSMLSKTIPKDSSCL